MSVWDRISEIFINNEIIIAEDKELYSYGLQQGILMILNVTTTIVIGIICGMVWQSIIFLLSYIPLRTYVGGYHAKTQWRCYIFSILIISVALLGIKLIPWTNIIYFTLMFFAGSIISLLAPVEDGNKHLDSIEKTIYKKRSRVILSALCGIGTLLYIIGYPQISICILVALLLLGIMLILGNCKNKLRRLNYV
ncbi:accessory regulator AgrB [Alkalibaculum sp. M08DMB]|uniref:Accessory regulator AgrB n=1 Tax=Alkalibaculum sporogenes TaxID=2655001 RepID=A0A6A7KAQ9_9FIRM|nr:accessory regulator AgrB [Alkalibaculum sporogenes]